MKIYTKTGDDGTTGLLGQQRVRKDDVRIEAYGEVDEANTALGVIITQLPTSLRETAVFLTGIQNDLFIIGTVLGTPAHSSKTFAYLHPDRASSLEQVIDEMEKELPALAYFILPQGTPLCVYTHTARAVARRAERRVVALAGLESIEPQILIYLNRLSDYLFVLARWLNHREGGIEIPWHNADHAEVSAPPKHDRLEATLHKLVDEKRKRETLFEKTALELERKKKAAENLFRKNVDSINKEGGPIEKPVRDIDLD